MLDIIMGVLFILFMVFVFGGYHKAKSGEREALREEQELEKENLEVNSDNSAESKKDL